MTLRVIYNYILVTLGIRRLMPRDIINRIEIRECREQLVPYRENISIDGKVFMGRERSMGRWNQNRRR